MDLDYLHSSIYPGPRTTDYHTDGLIPWRSIATAQAVHHAPLLGHRNGLYLNVNVPHTNTTQTGLIQSLWYVATLEPK
jgi:hypothetical protein